MKKICLCILCVLLLSGCQRTTKIFVKTISSQPIDREDPDIVIEQDGEGGVTFEILPGGTIKGSVDNRKPTVWERFIQPIFKGAANQSRTQTNLN